MWRRRPGGRRIAVSPPVMSIDVSHPWGSTVMHGRVKSPGRADLASAVDEKRLWARHMKMAEFGARPDGGVNRQALSSQDIAARGELIGWAKSLGYECATDPVGNLFIRREGRRSELPVIMTGSHLDSQPAGGKFDGTFGVLAGLEVLQAFDACGIVTERAVEVAVWTNEEGSRFSPGMTGSAAFVGSLSLDKVFNLKDQAGICFKDALEEAHAAIPELPRRSLGFPVGAYIEAHIEQGPVLERANCLIGVVSGIQGARWFSVGVSGVAMHAGTVPRSMRRDAFKATASMVNALGILTADEEDLARFTVGRVIVEPNSPNTIPGLVNFTIDYRHPRAAVLQTLGDQITVICSAHADGCKVEIDEILTSEPVEFPTTIIETISHAAGDLGLASMVLPSGAFHDAKSMSMICPTGMIFVPCANGISHSPSERAEPAALTAGARVLAATIERLAGATNL
jgi:N-carbamoyl-L-amino-acid hydrolase